MLELTSKMLSLFRGDNRKVMQQLLKGYGTNHLGPLSSQDINDHIAGIKSVAIYLLDQNQKCSTICFDIDIPKVEIPEVAMLREKVKVESFLPEVRKIITYLKDIYHLSNENFLIEDTGGRGYHIWSFFNQPVDGERCVTFMNDVKLNCGFPELEIFPPSFSQGNKGFSKSLVRLPLGLHRSYGNSRSRFLDPDSFEVMPAEDLAAELAAVRYLDENILRVAEDRYANVIEQKALRTRRIRDARTNTNAVAVLNLGEVGELISMCPALLALEEKAENEGNLKHHERFVFAAILKNFQDGEPLLHKILSKCDNYDLERSSYQIGTIKACAISCEKMQSSAYGICGGWCNTKFKESAENGRHPSPVWFAELNRLKEEIDLDDVREDIFQVAAVDNLAVAWKKAKQQAIDRDVFYDKMGFDLFEKDIWNNLAMLGLKLKEGKWKHNNFLSIKIPKDKASGSSRPFCSVSVRESVVQLAVMNVIGPKIDSRFHPRSLGNRLAISPKSDDQIFQDWRRQNAIREFRKNSFSEYEPHNHYVLLDVRKFYEFIKHDKLIRLMRQFVDDQDILDVIQQYIQAPWERTTSDYDGQKKVMGIPQGPALSALLANIYLNDIDHWLSDHCIDFVRYVDDIAILFEDKETADSILAELEEMLSMDYGLSLNTEKTVGPLPITDNEKLNSWLDRVRYDFVRSGVTKSSNITDTQKRELFETLTKVAGNIEEDPRTLTKSLGFYVRFSESLQSDELTNTVYKVAEYLLEEDRPRHNATCIAVRSLIKASNEPNGDNWPAFKSLMESRGDDYFKIVFAQECARLLESIEGIVLREEIIKELCAIAIVVQSPVAAAAAIDTLLMIAPAYLSSLSIVALKSIGFGDHEMLRPRAIALLFHLNETSESSLARIDAKTIFEIEVYTHLIKESARGLFAELVILMNTKPLFQMCLPLLVRKGILLRHKEGALLFSLLNGYSEQRNIAYYIADKITAELVMDESVSADIISMLSFLKDLGETAVASEIYQFAKYSKWLKNSNEFSEFEKRGDEQAYLGFREPVIADTEILEPLFEANRFVQRARDISSGKSCFHELIKDQELAKSGRNLNAYLLAFNELIRADLLLEAKTELRSAEGKLLVKTIVPLGSQSLRDYLEGRVIDPHKVHKLLVKINQHVESIRKTLARISESILVPVPTLDTIFVDVNENIRSGLTSLTIGSERKFVGRSGAQYMLQADEWLVETIGLLFFELSSGLCSVKDFVDLKIANVKAINIISLEQGKLLLDILLKSTRPVPASRYAATKFQLEDIGEWAKLQSAINLCPTITVREQEMLNVIWSMDMRIKRYLIKNVTGREELFELSFDLQARVISSLKESELHLESFLKEGWQDIQCGEHYNKHVAAAQAIGIAAEVDSKITVLKLALSLIRDISFTKWLLIAAAGIELEALRRSCLTLVKESEIRSELVGFIGFVERHGAENVILSYISKGEPFVDEIIAVLQQTLPEVCNRLKQCLSRDDFPSVVWNADLLMIQFLIVSKFYGFKVDSTSGEDYQIIAKKRLFNVSQVGIALYNILAVYRCEHLEEDNTNMGFGTEYKVNTIIRINRCNLHLLRGMYRNHDHLHETITGKIRFAEAVKLNIRNHKVSVDLRNSLVIEKMHNDFDVFHIKGCPFSIDMQYLNGKLVPLTASFPIVTYNSIEKKLFPKLLLTKKHLLGFHGVNFQRKNPITSAFIDSHLIWLLVAVAITYIAYVWVLQETSAGRQTLLNILVYSLALTTFSMYVSISYKRLRMHFKTLDWITDSLTQ